jgi:hypothetical protein
VITDPLFYLVSLLAVILLGLSKGGFLGLGVMSLPLMSLFVPPLQAQAIILPTMLVQDALTVWVYRRSWSAPNLKLMVPAMIAGIAIAALFAASPVRHPCATRHRHHRRRIRGASLARRPLRASRAAPQRVHGSLLWNARRLHHDAGQCRRTRMADASSAATARQAHLCRHVRHVVCCRATS